MVTSQLRLTRLACLLQHDRAEGEGTVSIIDRLSGAEDPKISAHHLFGALTLLANGDITRAEIETGMDIATTGTDATELTFMINTGSGATDRQKYLNTLHAIFLLQEKKEFVAQYTKTELQAMLTSAAA